MSLRKKPRDSTAGEPGKDPGWSFGQEADYAKDGTPRWELAGALSMVALWVILGFRADGPVADRSSDACKVVQVCGWLWLFFPLFVNGFAMLLRLSFP